MKTSRTRRLRRAALFAVSTVSVAATVLTAGTGGAVASPASGGANPIVRIDDGLVRGTTAGTVDEFLGLPYAAPPTGNLRWRPPAPPASWEGVRDATQFGPSCPQATVNNPYLPPGPISEDCLYLNVYTPTSRSGGGGGRPVLVWIHGGGLTVDGARNYDGSKLAADGTVVVTINYRLGALGFLAHPALASRPGGPAGNYGLMDQQAALRWVQRNIAQFGGDPHNVTIAGQSAGGLSVLAQLVSPGARGLFQRAIVQSGAFALTQQPLATAEAAGEKFATAVGCADQTAQCLRSAPVSEPGQQLRRRDPGRRRRLGAHPADRDGDRPRAVRPGADPQRHHPRRGTDLRRRPRPDRKPGDEHTAGCATDQQRELPDRHRPRPGRVGRAGRGDRE